ncbi:MAG: GGDEF domain-containing protein [Rhodospirillales bacterium]|nr:GGDEF domain-containing protein [Rhodospirillales bacterium]
MLGIRAGNHMVDISKPDTFIPVSKTGSEGQRQAPGRQRKGGTPAKPDTPPALPSLPPRPAEAFLVGGLLASEMTPEIQAAFDQLAQQIEPLRRETEAAKAREKQLREAAERHHFLPAGNRRAFERELGHVVSHLHHLSAPASVVCLHVASADRIRRHHGRAAREAALAHALQVLRQQLHPTDVVAAIGGNDFGIILLVANAEGARAKAERLVQALAARPWAWKGLDVPLEAAAGICPLEAGAAPAAVIAAADRDLVLVRNRTIEHIR